MRALEWAIDFDEVWLDSSCSSLRALDRRRSVASKVGSRAHAPPRRCVA